MIKYKHLLFLILLALLLRAPSFLFRGYPDSDELRYFTESLSVYNNVSGGWEIDPIDRGKLFFVILQAPVSGILYSLTGNTALSASLFPFLCSILFVAFFYLLGYRMYGRDTAFWVGLVSAVIPYLSYYAGMMYTHTFFTYFLLLGAWLLYLYFESGSRKLLLAACIVLALLLKIRIEGIGVYLAAVYLVLLEFRRRTETRETGRRGLLSLAAILVICPLTVLLMFKGIAALMIAPQQGSSAATGVLLGKALGNLARKLSALYGLRLPGGFLESDKLDYLLHNFYLVPYAAATVAYDALKTLFILPTRVIPPLLFIFLGVSLLAGPSGSRAGRLIEKLFVLSFLVSLIYPLAYLLAHSRYIYLALPAAILFIAKGIRRLEQSLDEKLSWKIRFLTPKVLLSFLILAYVGTAYYFLQIGFLLKNRPLVVVFASQQSVSGPMGEVVAWINDRYGEKKMAVMGLYFHTAFLRNKERVDFPVEVKNVDGEWLPQPLSLEKTLELLRDRGEALLVLSKNQVFGPKAGTHGAPDYFAMSMARNTGFTDESLELMRDSRARDSAYQLRELQGLMDGTVQVPGLDLVRTFDFQATGDTVMVFFYRAQAGPADP